MGQRRELRHTRAPAGELRKVLGPTVGCELPRLSHVADDNGHVGVATEECRGRLHLCRAALQVEREPVRGEEAVTALEGRRGSGVAQVVRVMVLACYVRRAHTVERTVVVEDVPSGQGQRVRVAAELRLGSGQGQGRG